MVDILGKLMNDQRDNIQIEYRMLYNDLKRLSQYIDDDFFTDMCCIWKRKIDYHNKKYITFYFNKKKISLYRLLYINFENSLGQDEYIRTLCPNKGLCCNVRHFQKFKYHKK